MGDQKLKIFRKLWCVPKGIRGSADILRQEGVIFFDFGRTSFITFIDGLQQQVSM